MQWLAVALGGAVGALMRYGASNAIAHTVGRGFPYGTLFVNVAGSFAIGILFVMLSERAGIDPVWRALLIAGLLGAFTTFSTFSLESLQLLESGAYMRAALNVLLSVVLCLAAAWAGLRLGRMM